MSSNNTQVGGTHYKSQAIQPWDYITSNNIPYLEGNVIKYVSRWKYKGGLQDLEKARHYLDKLIELNQAEPDTIQGIVNQDDGWIEWGGGHVSPVPDGTNVQFVWGGNTLLTTCKVSKATDWSQVNAYRVVK